MGVWIETDPSASWTTDDASHPVWVCGLKQSGKQNRHHLPTVTPCMGVWIETVCTHIYQHCRYSHTLYGCVD